MPLPPTEHREPQPDHRDEHRGPPKRDQKQADACQGD